MGILCDKSVKFATILGKDLEKFFFMFVNFGGTLPALSIFIWYVKKNYFIKYTLYKQNVKVKYCT